MSRTVAFALGLSGALAIATAPGVHAKPLKVLSQKTVDATGHVESVGYDAADNIFYLSNFGPALRPASKDGKGHMTTMSLGGKILKEKALPIHGEVMNKPKGNWIANGHLWVTDIDSVWEFDLKTKKSRRLRLPGVIFANDTAVLDGALYVSDNEADKVVEITPADFLGMKSKPKIITVYSGKGIHPNGLWPARNGDLLMVGFAGESKPRGIYAMKPGSEPRPISRPIGMLDGLYQTKDSGLLVTDYVTGSLLQWNAKAGVRTLAKGFESPADFGVVPDVKGYLVALPDIDTGKIHLIQLGP